MLATLILGLAVSADVTPQQAKLLKTFRQEFIAVTPGKGKFPNSFVMGRSEGSMPSERPAHKVTFGFSFEIAKYEVPQNLWQAVMGNNPSKWKGPRNSVEMLSLAEAETFCQKATELMRAAKLIKANEVVRLPSEAEWEYVARAGTKTVYSFGDKVTDLDAYAWHTGNAAGNDPPVGAKKPNPWGLYDIHGYLWEWCRDAAHENYKMAPADGSAWTKGGIDKAGVLRGGSWKDKAEKLTSSYRQIAPKNLRDDAVGLRCVLAQAAKGENKQAAVADEFRPVAQNEVVPSKSKLEVIWNDGEFTEGPALAPDGSIVFSDIGQTIFRFDPKTGKTSVYRRPSGRANGLMFDRHGRLIACEGAMGGGRRISLTEKDGKVQTLSDTYAGKRFNSPNDLAIDGKGRVYFTDPRYTGDEPRELDFEGVFLVDTDGKTTLATRDVEKPNGILVSIDGKHVYVADNNPKGVRHFLRFDVKKDGTLTNKQVLFDFGTGRGIDGMTLDVHGNIYATAGSGDKKAGIYVFSPAAKHLAFIPTPGDPTNCVFGGGDDSRTLYITANGPRAKPGEKRRYALYRFQLANKGHHLVPLNE